MAEMKNDEKMAITTEEPYVVNNSDNRVNHVQTNDIHGDKGDNGAMASGANNGNGHQKKKTSSFQITRVIKPTERPTRVSDHEPDEPDELDETNTDDVSLASENLDASKGVELDNEQPEENYISANSSESFGPEKNSFVPLSGTTSLASNTIFHIPQNKAGNDTSFMSLLQPISETQAQVVTESTIPEEPSEENLKMNESRFKVVKIESELPFKRGRWACLEYRSERNEAAAAADDVTASGNSSAASSVYHTQEIEENLRNLPPEPYQNGDHASLPVQQNQNGKHITQNSQMPNQPLPTTVPISIPSTTSTIAAYTETNSQGVQVINSRMGAEEQIPATAVAPEAADYSQSFTTTSIPTTTTGTLTNANEFRAEIEGFSNASEYNAVTGQSGENDNSVDSTTQMQRNLASALMKLRASQDYSAVSPEIQSQLSVAQNSNSQSPSQTQQTSDTNDVALPASAEPVFQLGQPNSLDSSDRDSVTSTEPEGLQKTATPSLQLFNFVGKQDAESGASTLAIDNKIEQAMDLVKSHLMYAVREEVEVLREQIRELIEKNNQLEIENNLLRKSASPDTLAKLQQAKGQLQAPQAAAVAQQAVQQPPTTTS